MQLVKIETKTNYVDHTHKPNIVTFKMLTIPMSCNKSYFPLKSLSFK